MKRDLRQVFYSYEHGDESLPRLKDLVSETPDPERSRILAYLRTHCISTTTLSKIDEINPEKRTGSYSIYSDGVYCWDNRFTYYVDKYNIPIPQAFRQHILENFDSRMKRHMLLRLVDCVEILNNPYLGREYYVRINKDGNIRCWNNTDGKAGFFTRIDPEDAAYIIDPVMSELFCYDTDRYGEGCIDGYYWKLTFFRKGKPLVEKEGRTGEDAWRCRSFRDILEFIGRYIPQDLGLDELNRYDTAAET